MKRVLSMAVAIAALTSLTGCAPKVGSEAWCKKLDAKPKGDWTANEMADYTKNCILRKKN